MEEKIRAALEWPSMQVSWWYSYVHDNACARTEEKEDHFGGCSNALSYNIILQRAVLDPAMAATNRSGSFLRMPIVCGIGSLMETYIQQRPIYKPGPTTFNHREPIYEEMMDLAEESQVRADD